MHIFNNINALPEFRRTVVTIGSFDGIHQGHQEILRQVVALAEEEGAESVVITFDPHPRLVVYPNDTAVELITDTAEKCRLLAEIGIKNVVLVRFDAAFAEQSAEAYIADFLVKRFQPSHIVIGYDHHFGKNRKGNLEMLQHYAPVFAYKIVEISPQTVDNITVSSTKIRTSLYEGQIEATNHLLGRPFALNGTVVQGAQIGRTIGYPTANISLHSAHALVPKNGIYAARIFLLNKKNEPKNGRICSLYIGNRPSIEDDNHRTIEAHIFDFDQNIYGEMVHLEIIANIRDDKKLNGLDALKAQIALDNAAVLKVFEVF